MCCFWLQDALISDSCSTFSAMQTSFQSYCQIRQSMERLNSVQTGMLHSTHIDSVWCCIKKQSLTTKWLHETMIDNLVAAWNSDWQLCDFICGVMYGSFNTKLFYLLFVLRKLFVYESSWNLCISNMLSRPVTEMYM